MNVINERHLPEPHLHCALDLNRADCSDSKVLSLHAEVGETFIIDDTLFHKKSIAQVDIVVVRNKTVIVCSGWDDVIQLTHSVNKISIGVSQSIILMTLFNVFVIIFL